MAKKSRTRQPSAKRSPAKKARQVGAIAVTFTDAKIIAARAKPPFPDQQGNYKNPDIVIAGGVVPILPANVGCPGTLVIYSSDALVVPNCAGFAGPGAGNNAVVNAALRNANAVAARIPCVSPCLKNVTEIWRGWDCGNNPVTAVGAVELEITCSLSA